MLRSPVEKLLGRLLPAAVLAAGLSGCVVDREPNYEWLPWINHMLRSSAAESYAAAPKPAAGKEGKLGQGVYKNDRAMQLPPAGTVPVGFSPLHFSADPAGAEKAGLAYPKAPIEATAENLARGKWGFETFCVPCHAADGSGAGPVAKRAGWNFPIGWSDSNAAKMPDGHVFHIISYGRGNMPSYSAQLSQIDRWKIVLHLRQLQQQNGAAPKN